MGEFLPKVSLRQSLVFIQMDSRSDPKRLSSYAMHSSIPTTVDVFSLKCIVGQRALAEMCSLQEFL